MLTWNLLANLRINWLKLMNNGNLIFELNLERMIRHPLYNLDKVFITYSPATSWHCRRAEIPCLMVQKCWHNMQLTFQELDRNSGWFFSGRILNPAAYSWCQKVYQEFEKLFHTCSAADKPLPSIIQVRKPTKMVGDMSCDTWTLLPLIETVCGFVVANHLCNCLEKPKLDLWCTVSQMMVTGVLK